MDAEALSELAGYYGPGSITWRLDREAILSVGGSRAVLMQLAHPLVAAGVSQHSVYASDPYGRWRRTFVLSQALVFGTRSQARQAAQTINHRHQPVRGTLDTSTGAFASGAAYQARDPALLFWVHATLVDTILYLYPLLIAPLAPAEQETYYQESLRSVRLLGLPPDYAPPTLAAFHDYMHTMLTGDCLAVTPAARELAALVQHPPMLPAAWPLFEAISKITIGLLPTCLREQYGYRWGKVQQHLFDAWVRITKRTIQRLPPRLREFSTARAAEQRIRRALHEEDRTQMLSAAR